jgi:hypothetical protein
MLAILPIAILWVATVLDLFRRNISGVEKVLWLMGILILPIIGPLVYVLFKPKADYGVPAGAIEEMWSTDPRSSGRFY